jgi:hypothetical protein
MKFDVSILNVLVLSLLETTVFMWRNTAFIEVLTAHSAMFPLAKVSAIMPAIMPSTATRIALALATLGDATAKVSNQGAIMPAISCTISS